MDKDYNIAALLDYYGCFLTERQVMSVDYYYNEDLSLAEIGECLGITRQGVHDNIRRAESILYDAEKKLRLFEKSRLFDQQKQDILNQLEIILSRRNIISKPVVDRLVLISDMIKSLEN